jgi:hypothetical protein
VSVDLEWAPLLPPLLMAAAAVLGASLLALAALRRARAWPLRALVLVVLLAAVANPSLRSDTRAERPDVAVVVADRSASQTLEQRGPRTDQALAALGEALARQPDLEVRVIEAAADDDRGAGTRLFAALDRALADRGGAGLAGIVLVTDGQVHDVPDADAVRRLGVPVHVVLTGRPDERDRRLVVEQAPAFGLVGRDARLRLRVEDQAAAAAAPATVHIRGNGRPNPPVSVPPGVAREVTVEVPHAGANVVEIEADAVDGELSTLNNRAVVTINGVRDRLRVLLISGQPHQGERMWRNLLKSDPAVDLVHFTILRPPDKDDFAAINELSLIAFPVQELFEEKLDDFDLVIFDRYAVQGVVPWRYVERIVDYLKQGGAVLLASGPELAGPSGLYQTPLGPVLPAAPTGRVFEAAFRPLITAVGRRHPVTSSLPGEVAMGDAEGETADKAPRWGHWFRVLETEVRSGSVLMAGAGDQPLLVLDRVEDGRVAQVLSDQLWLWARGFDGGGPSTELLRRVVHWLMREPELEEERLEAAVDRGRLVVQRRSLGTAPVDLAIRAPGGEVTTLSIAPGDDGISRAEMPATEVGLYRVDDGRSTVFATGGALDPREFRDLRSTDAVLAPVAEVSGGGIAWVVDGLPQVRRTRPGHDTAGRGWIGFVRNGDSVVTGTVRLPLLPALPTLALLLAGLAAAWWREGR